MFEETNQMMEESEEQVNLPENLFDDEEEASQMQSEPSPSPAVTPLPEGEARTEEREDGREAETAQQNEGEARQGGNHAGEASPGENVLRVKFNGEERNLSLDEARTLAQKGLNYDHVVSERDRNRSAFDFLMERAKSDGITVEQLIERERAGAENQRLEAKMREIRERDDDASEETIKRLAQFELEAEKRSKDKERETAKAQELKAKQEAEIEGWNRLFAEHPELKAKEGEQVSPKVLGLIELIGQGFTPVEAFYIQRSRELEVQQKMQADAKEAKRKSIGSLSGNQKTEEEDDFLAGFNSI